MVLGDRGWWRVEWEVRFSIDTHVKGVRQVGGVKDGMADEGWLVGVIFGLVSLSSAVSSLVVHDSERVDSMIRCVEKGSVCQSRSIAKPVNRWDVEPTQSEDSANN